MISVEYATELLKEYRIEAKSEDLPLDVILGKILQEDIYADRDFPPYDRVAMDGIAINLQECKEIHSLSFCEGIARAGDSKKKKERAFSYFKVSTGAVLPEGMNAVLPFEYLEFTDSAVHWSSITLENMMNIDAKGGEYQKGALLLKKGKKITVQDIALLASVGKSFVLVALPPKIIIITTGDELIEINEIPKDYEIRMSNAIQAKVLLEAHGFTNVDILHCPDTEEATKEFLNASVISYDMLIFTGGISAGKYDFVKIAVQNSNIKEIFYQVTQRPGKPLFFGMYKDAIPIFAIPGNPVAFLTCLRKFVITYLYLCAGFSLKPSLRILGESFLFKKKLTRFLFAKESDTDSSLLPMPEVNSGNVYALVESIGFFELSAEEDLFIKGKEYYFYYWLC